MPIRHALIGIAAAGAVLAAGSAFGQGDQQRGQQVFQDNCSGCHVLTGEGYAAPPLAGVYGRKAGAVAGFGYTDAMKKSGIVWDDASLRQFLADPAKAVPGTAMSVNLPDAQQRDDVIAYLKSQSPGAH
jgi:cytochrome c